MLNLPTRFNPASSFSTCNSKLEQPLLSLRSTWFKFATEEVLFTFAKGLVPENTTSSLQVLKHNNVLI